MRFLSDFVLRSGLREALVVSFVLLSGWLLWASLPIEVSLAQSNDMPFSADPAPGGASYKAGYFVVQAASGETVTETLVLRNDSDAPINLRIASVDATTGAIGGISYGLPTEPVTRVGAWTVLPANEIGLAPRETKNVPLTITVPPGTASGDHIGGIAVWLPRVQNQEDPAAAGQSAVIDTQMRRVLSVHVVVPGPAKPLLEIEDVKPVVRPDGLYLEIKIANKGQLLTRGDGFIELPENDFQHDFSLDTFMPETSIAYPIKWINDPDEGTYPAHVVIHYDQLTADWQGSITIGPGLTTQEQEREGNNGNKHILLYASLTAAVIAFGGLTIFLIRR